MRDGETEQETDTNRDRGIERERKAIYSLITLFAKRKGGCD